MVAVPGRIRVVVAGQSVQLTSLKMGAADVPMFTDAALGSQVTFPLTGVVADTTYYVSGDYANVQLDMVIASTAGAALGTFSGVTGPARELLFAPHPSLSDLDATASTSSGGASLASAAPSTQALGDAAVVGTGTHAARDDHKHAMPASPLPVASGGTGAATLTGVLKGNGTGAVTAAAQLAVADGGTGAASLTSGALLKGAGTGPIAPADLTGDVTTSGALVTAIGAGKVTLAMQVNAAANSIRGNNTGAPATPLDLTMAQVMAALSGTAGADFSMNSHKITNQLDPTSAQDSATKNYVDAGVKTLTNTRIAPLVATALTDAATTAWNVDNGAKFTLLATSGVGNTRALGDPSGTVKDGESKQLVYTQDATGGRAMTVSGTGVKIATSLGGGTTIPQDTSANAVNVIQLLTVGSTLYVVSVVRVA